MRVIFLDFDGVLNSGKSEDADLYAEGTLLYSADQLDQDKVDRLNTIVEATGAVVVIISSWRTRLALNDIREMLRARGFKGAVLGDTERLHRTPDGEARNRGHEIVAWLRAAGTAVERFVILDDESYEDDDNLNFKIVSPKDGLEDHHVKHAIDVLTHL